MMPGPVNRAGGHRVVGFRWMAGPQQPSSHPTKTLVKEHSRAAAERGRDRGVCPHGGERSGWG